MSDNQNEFRRSSGSPVIDMLYEDYFIFPNSHKSHEVLHTHYHEDKRI